MVTTLDDGGGVARKGVSQLDSGLVVEDITSQTTTGRPTSLAFGWLVVRRGWELVRGFDVVHGGCW